jgi:hypothetical protein
LDGAGYREIWIVSAGSGDALPARFPAALAFTGLVTGLDPLRGVRVKQPVVRLEYSGRLAGLRMTKSRRPAS